MFYHTAHIKKKQFFLVVQMAQYASRASVALHTELYFRSRREVREGHVLMVRRNALIVLVMHYGLETPMYFPKELTSAGTACKQTMSLFRYTPVF